DCWITGLRRQQSDTRSKIGIVELYVFDAAIGRDIVKVNPMANWTREEVWEYIKRHKIPYNPLHDAGYRSIGCWPCTRKTASGENSTVLLWLARKAFLGHVPFPLVHVDTTYKIPSMIEYRDRLVKEWGLQLVVGKNEEVLKSGVTFPNGKATRVECCGTLKKDALKAVLDKHHFTGVIVGVRRDEEPTRAKDRYFSPRDKNMEWNVEDQPPELWDQ